MDSTNIDLIGSKISHVCVQEDTVSIHFAPAYLIKTMTGSVERTRWWQNATLIFQGAELDRSQPLPKLPADCTGGDVGENIYTYRDMIPVPLHSRGQAHCGLSTAGNEQAIQVQAQGVTLELEGVAKYIEHLLPAD